MVCACMRGTPGRLPDPGQCAQPCRHGWPDGHCACAHEPRPHNHLVDGWFYGPDGVAQPFRFIEGDRVLAAKKRQVAVALRRRDRRAARRARHAARPS